MRTMFPVAALPLLVACNQPAANDAPDGAAPRAQPVAETTGAPRPAGAIPDALYGESGPPVSGPGAGSPAPAPAAAFSYPMRLVGTEPFWGGRITPTDIMISGADRPEVSFPVTNPPEVTGTGARWRSVASGGATLEVTIVHETCSDGMSDKRYPFRATVVVGGETLQGCAIREADFGGER